MKRQKRKTLNELKADCIVWNHEHPVGTPVLYHPIIGRKEGRETRTRGEAYVLGDHTAVVFVEGVSGCVALDALDAKEDGTCPQCQAADPYCIYCEGKGYVTAKSACEWYRQNGARK